MAIEQTRPASVHRWLILIPLIVVFLWLIEQIIVGG